MADSVELKPSTIMVGVAFVLTWAAMLYVVLRRSGGGSPMVVNNIGLPNVLGMPGGWQLEQGGGPQPVYQAANPNPSARNPTTKMATFTLQDSQASRVFTAASDRHWTVTLRNIGPPGSIAWVADSPNNLNFPSMSTQIPVGTPVEIHLAPRSGLFAIGSTPGVTLTVTGGEELG